MLRAIFRRWLAARVRSDDGEAADSRFLPSVLDASVRYAHGTNNTGVERELAAIEEQARQLEDQHREK